MKVKVVFEDKVNEVEIKGESTIEDLLKQMGINTESVLVKRNGFFVPVENDLNDGDYIEILSVVSNG
ncbi:MAG: MoaD/ThiS family protein [Candidatus Aenigmarchaeota archaeon]|nr:MoaD/ThiS family protein [Candidatus Aenigmarchaeota archaeon]